MQIGDTVLLCSSEEVPMLHRRSKIFTVCVALLGTAAEFVTLWWNLGIFFYRPCRCMN